MRGVVPLQITPTAPAVLQPEGVLRKCEHLICANCGGPVVKGRCPACRATREQMHHGHANYTPHILIAAALLILVLAALAVHGSM